MCDGIDNLRLGVDVAVVTIKIVIERVEKKGTDMKN